MLQFVEDVIRIQFEWRVKKVHIKFQCREHATALARFAMEIKEPRTEACGETKVINDRAKTEVPGVKTPMTDGVTARVNSCPVTRFGGDGASRCGSRGTSELVPCYKDSEGTGRRGVGVGGTSELVLCYRDSEKARRGMNQLGRSSLTPTSIPKFQELVPRVFKAANLISSPR